MKVGFFDSTKVLLESKLKDLYNDILNTVNDNDEPIYTILKDLEFKSDNFKYKFILDRRNKTVKVSYSIINIDNYNNHCSINDLKVEEFLKINSDLLSLLNKMRFKINDYCRK